DLRIVGGREVRAAAGGDVQSRAPEERDGRILQTAFGYADAQLHGSASAGLMSRGSVKHDLVPVWQTRPSPSTYTRKSRVSRSQSVVAESTRRRFPEVSPFIHNFFRVRE